jgi:hypothetical protein
MRHLLHLSNHGSIGVKTAGEHKPGTEILDKREEITRVSNESVSYLISKLVPSGKKMKKIAIIVDSKD